MIRIWYHIFWDTFYEYTLFVHDTYLLQLMVGMTESGDPATGNINHASVIRHEFGCTCGVVDNLTPLGAHLIHDVL